MRLYFGHPVNSYDTDLERWIIAEIERLIPGSVVENPNQPHHQEGYKKYERAMKDGMRYFLHVVLKKCHGGVVLPFGDGYLGAGIFRETTALLEAGKPVWAIRPEHLANRDLRFQELHWDGEILALTVPETRARLRGPDGVRPYA